MKLAQDGCFASLTFPHRQRSYMISSSEASSLDASLGLPAVGLQDKRHDSYLSVYRLHQEMSVRNPWSIKSSKDVELRHYGLLLVLTMTGVPLPPMTHWRLFTGRLPN
jgi:hypothetical protein